MKEIELSKYLRLSSFYRDGGVRMKLGEDEVADLELIYEHIIPWEADPDGLYNRVPKGVRPADSDWPKGLSDPYERSTFMNEATLRNTHPSLKQKIGEILLSDRFAPFSSSFDFEIPFIDLWDGSEGCGFHWDGIESTDFLVLVYISDRDGWLEGLGGELVLGRRNDELDSVGVPVRQKVETLGYIAPANGTIVVVNNRDPHLVHRCNLLESSSEKRVTLTFGVSFRKKGAITDSPRVSFKEPTER